MATMLPTARETVAPGRPSGRPRFEQFLGLLSTVQPGERRSVLLCCSYAFLLLVSYYILKTLRESLLLVAATAEIKSYAYAAAAAVLLVLVPLYGLASRCADKSRLIRGVTLFFIANLIIFYAAGYSGADIGFAYYVWVSVFGVTILAQFWAYTADLFDVPAGQRLFPAIMVGATLGGLAGPVLARTLFGALGAWPLMLIAIALLAATLPLANATRRCVPEESRTHRNAAEPRARSVLGGLALVGRDPYLLLLAVLVVLLNCVSTTGEYVLTELVIRNVEDRIALDPGLDKATLIAAFYGDFYLAVNALTLLAQLFVVARVFRWIGVHGAVLVLPIIALIGYGLVVFLPVFTILRCVKIVENSIDYSLMNTARHALYLPLPSAAKYDGKMATDAFFWRFGDLLQAGIVFAGLHWLGFGYRQFALLNIGLVCIWLGVAAALARRYAERTNAPRPRLLPSRLLAAPRLVRHAAAALAASILGILALTVPAPAEAGGARIFDRNDVLVMDVFIDFKAFCRNPGRKDCEDAPATLTYRDNGGTEQRVDAALRARGRYRKETGACTLPALFVFFTGDTRGTLFEGETMLPLTTHCQHGSQYEQYVLKEYVAYRIYNLLTDKSLRVRLARVTYHDTSGRAKPLERYAFFTEHFNSLARRHDATVWKPEHFDPLQADANEIATLDLFQYMIGNTDWSVIYGHNIVLIRDTAGLVTPVAYDFDFSGLVGAHYASVAPQLPIRNVRERLFRGVCRPETAWPHVVQSVQSARPEVNRSIADVDMLSKEIHVEMQAYIDTFYDLIGAPMSFNDSIGAACRAPGRTRIVRSD